MPDPNHCTICEDRCIVKCSNCQARGYLLRNEGESTGSGDDIVICARCQGTGSEPCQTCSRSTLPDG